MEKIETTILIMATFSVFLVVVLAIVPTAYAQTSQKPTGFNVIFEVDPATNTTITVHSSSQSAFKEAMMGQLNMLNKTGLDAEVDKMINEGIAAYESLAKQGPVPTGVELYRSQTIIIGEDGPVCQTCGGEICWWP
jgi:hypothetical protein